MNHANRKVDLTSPGPGKVDPAKTFAHTNPHLARFLPTFFPTASCYVYAGAKGKGHTMKKHVVATTLCALGLCTALAGCGTQPSSGASGTSSASSASSAPSSSQTNTVDGLAQDSILRAFEDDGSRRLVQDMKDGKTPTSCVVFYDEDGTQPVVTATSEDDVKKLYELVGNITVGSKDQQGTADSRHFVSFKRQDGSTVGFRFPNKGVLVGPDSNYQVDGDGALWDKVRELQGNEKGADNAHDVVVVSDEDGLVTDCPASAAVGNNVRLTVNHPLDVQTVVRVNGETIASQGATYEFTMPDRIAQVEVFTQEYPNGGGS